MSFEEQYEKDQPFLKDYYKKLYYFTDTVTSYLHTEYFNLCDCTAGYARGDEDALAQSPERMKSTLECFQITLQDLIKLHDEYLKLLPEMIEMNAKIESMMKQWIALKEAEPDSESDSDSEK